MATATAAARGLRGAGCDLRLAFRNEPSRSILILEHAMNKSSLLVYGVCGIAAIALYVILLVLPG